MTPTGAVAPQAFEERTENFMDWVRLHSRHLTIAAVAIIVLAAGLWFYKKSHEARARNAAIALSQAEQAVIAGNLALAQSELEKVVNRYAATASGKQARLLLGQVLYERGQYQRGVEELQKLVGSDAELVRAEAYNLIGAGYEQQGKYADAAEAYRKAADAAAFPADRDSYLANAARALTSAGKTAEAKEIWTKLAEDPSSPVSAEARVRLGELEAKPAKS